MNNLRIHVIYLILLFSCIYVLKSDYNNLRRSHNWLNELSRSQSYKYYKLSCEYDRVVYGKITPETERLR